MVVLVDSSAVLSCVVLGCVVLLGSVVSDVVVGGIQIPADSASSEAATHVNTR